MDHMIAMSPSQKCLLPQLQPYKFTGMSVHQHKSSLLSFLYFFHLFFPLILESSMPASLTFSFLLILYSGVQFQALSSSVFGGILSPFYCPMHEMAKSQNTRFTMEVAPPRFISVTKRQLTKILDTIMEEEKECNVDEKLVSSIHGSASLYLSTQIERSFLLNN